MVKVNAYCSKVGSYREFNLEEEIEKLRRMHDKVEMMPDNQKRYWAFKDYLSYYFFLSELFPDNQFPFNPFDFDVNKAGRRLERDNLVAGIELFDNLDLINEIYSKIREINDDCGLILEYDIRKKIDSRLGVELLEEFIKGMPKRFKNIFQKVMNGNMYNLLEEDNCYAYDLSYCGEYKILNSAGLNDYEAYYSIAHELGHCYHFDLVGGRNFKTNLDTEVPSMFFEIIFNMFADKYLYGKDYGMNTIFNRQSDMANIVALENVILSNSDNFEINYLTLRCRMNMNKLTSKDIDVLESIDITEECLEMGYIDREEDVSLFTYPLSNLLAIYFADIYMQDGKEGIKLLDNYLMLPPSVNLEDRLKMYDITGGSYKKLIRKVSDYGKRKHLI